MGKSKARIDTRSLGSQFKAVAKPNGSFIKVDIDNVYDTLEALAYFFYRKKHEWIAVCFFDAALGCRLIWFNKGLNHRVVPLYLSPDQALQAGRPFGTTAVIVAHNHPVSSYDIPNYGSRRLNIEAVREHKAQILDFSEADLSLGQNWRNYLAINGIAYAEAVFVAGNYTVLGDAKIIKEYNQHKPKSGCFVATYIFGEHAIETTILRAYRDIVLSKTPLGRALCASYYILAPIFVALISKHQRMRDLIRTLLVFIVHDVERRLENCR